MFPLAYLCFCLLLNSMTGALDFPVEGDVRAQRDFNAALAMPLLTAYFWFVIRLLHQNVASAIMGHLLSRASLSQFIDHREALGRRFFQHMILAAGISILLTAVYITNENLISLDLTPHVIVLDVMAVPFWFFFWLFLFQISSATHYVMREIIQEDNCDISYFRVLRQGAELGATNTLYALIGLALVPLFWFNKDVPAIDVFILVVFAGSLAFYLFWPVVSVHYQMQKTKHQALLSLESQIDVVCRRIAVSLEPDKNDHKQLQNLQHQKDNIEHVPTWVIEPRKARQMFGALLLVPLSWVFLILAEYLVG